MDYRQYCDLSSTDEEDMTDLMAGQAATKHGGLAQNGELPFYALPRAKKTSAEIIHEARAALGDGRAVVRTVDTTRPFTPRDRQRTLFGTAQSSTGSARPTSAFSMNSLSFDTSDSRPVSGVRLVPLNTRGFCKTASPRQESSDGVTFPSLPDAVGRPGSYHLPSLTGHERLNRRQFRAASLDKLPEEGEELMAAALSSRNAHSGPRERTRATLEPSPRPAHTLPGLARPGEPITVQRRIVEHRLELVLSQPEDAGDLHLSDLESSQRLPTEFSRRPAVDAEPEPTDDFGWSLFRKKRGIPQATGARPATKVVPPDIAYAESRPGSAVSDAGDAEPRSQEQQILALLARLTQMADDGADNEEVLTSVVDLYQLLAETKHLGRSSPHRIAALKTIFRFVDRQHSRLLVHISRTILALLVSGKNLINVCKLVFKVAQEDQNDSLFLEGNILEHLLETVGRSSPLEDGEACVYSYGALKFLTMNATLVSRLMNLGILDLVVLHMKLITTKKLESKRVSEQTGHALYQLTGVLRNLANVEATLPQLVSSGATREICSVLALFSADMDVISNVARILSIISTHDACCEQLVSSDLSFRACIKVLKKYPGANAIVVRLGYALGNLMARSEPARVKFFKEADALDTLLHLLELGTPEDVIVKLVRVVANMVINEEVGSVVSGSAACLSVLLGVLRTHSVDEHEELVLSSLSMLNNLTFYATEESVVFERQAEVTHCLCGMLRHEHTECQIEVLRVFGNLTRWPAVREALADRQVVSRLAGLLDSDNRELVYTTVGVLINLMTDPGKRQDFTSFGGIDKLVLVLEDFGYSDWQLAALVCKVLWNLGADTDDVGQVFSEQQADQLAVVLDEYLAEEQQIATMLRPLWEEFADVAASLLEKLDESLDAAAAAAAAPTEHTKTA
ncbi:armadillo repeat-containing protein 2-like [Pollicipes pollicipes]|uniref:armadillo repeat-containing protein 2-like n=1 Tax=Pollicipes pollicipes TaxID=41117 RepID=UPI001884C608|nr:armadillo repeat-containing protein 2-like [Pollicipes pollicipes]